VKNAELLAGLSQLVQRGNELSLMRIVFESFVKHEEARRFAIGRTPRRMKADSTHADASSAPATPPGGALAAITSVGGKTALVGSRMSKIGRTARGFVRRSKRSRYVSAAVKRAVYLRDEARCSFFAPDGRRCDARLMLELDHAEPWAKQGDSGIDNMRLRCRAHNQSHARECFGARHVEAKIAARRAGVSPIGDV
jgi:hypothetical protein